MVTIIYLFSALAFTIIISTFVFADKIEKANIERCERWKKEQMEAGMSEEEADHFLFAEPDFIL